MLEFVRAGEMVVGTVKTCGKAAFQRLEEETAIVWYHNLWMAQEGGKALRNALLGMKFTNILRAGGGFLMNSVFSRMHTGDDNKKIL